MSLIVIELVAFASLPHAVVIPVPFALPVIAAVVRLLAISVAAGRWSIRTVFWSGRILSSFVNLLAGIFENCGRVLHVGTRMVMNGSAGERGECLWLVISELHMKKSSTR